MVLLSVGEPTVARARASVDRQTIGVVGIIDVSDVRPFYRALNDGARQVTTEFFAQVDADMVLDPDCLELLRLAMLADPNIGVAIGFLRDPLVGRASGIRMFRRACFDDAEFGDSISPDTDFLDAMPARGWRAAYALRFDSRSREQWHTFGDHLPAYDALYTWRKYQMEGARYIYRGLTWGLEWHLGVVEQSVHPVALLARVAMLQGTLSGMIDDRLGRDGSDAYDASLLDWQTFRHTTVTAPAMLLRALSSLVLNPVAAYRVCHAVGQALRRRNAWPTFERAMSLIAHSRAPHRWVAQAGLCRGIMLGSAHALQQDETRLRQLLGATATPIVARVSAAGRALAALRQNPASVDGADS